MDAKSTPEERRASIERFRAVGQTFADGIASFRDRMTTTTRAEHANTPLSPGEGEAISPAPGAAQSACEHGDEDTHGMNESPPPLKKDMERLQNILFATERRVEMANNEVESVRAQHRALASSHERATKALDTLRAEHDGAVSRMRDACERGERATGEMARLRGEVLELERALHSRDDKLHQAERRATTDRNRAAALETVSMSLRRRVAISEEKMVDARTVHDAAVAREHAESELVAAKGETERWRARASATDTVRDRAGRAELAEHDLRKRVSLLEREISSRDVLLKQGLGERKKLKEFMSKYERELDEKDATIAKLRATIASRRRPLTRKDAVSEREVSENGSTRSTTWEKNVSATQTLGTQNLGTQTLGTQNLGTQNLGGTQNHDTTVCHASFFLSFSPFFLFSYLTWNGLYAAIRLHTTGC